MVSVQVANVVERPKSSANVKNKPDIAVVNVATQSRDASELPKLPIRDQASVSPQGKAVGSIGLTEASLEGVRAGLVIGLGAEGPLVRQMQELLGKAGYPLHATSVFGKTTESVLIRFQRDHGLQPTGKLGPTTLKCLENPLRETAFGRRLCRAGKAQAMGLGGYSSLGKCYTGVGLALEQTGVKVTGLSAYMAADQLARHPRFYEVKLPAASLPKLPAGAVVVWDRSASPAKRQWGGGYTHGHISIADGKGKEMSDYVDTQRTNHYASNRFRVFLPK